MSILSNRPRWGIGALDWLLALLLIGLALGPRIGWLEVVSLDPDESQYEAQASYLVATGQTAPAAIPFGPVYATEVYRWLAQWCGPYPTVATRTFILLLAGAMAGMIYSLVSRFGDRLSAFLAAAFWLSLSIYFQGRTANREWFSGIFVLAAIYLVASSWSAIGRRQAVYLILAGASSAMAVWLKEQAVYFLFPIPAAMVAEAILGRQLARPLRDALIYTVGGLLGTLLGLAPFIAAGSLDDYLEFLRLFAEKYAVVSQPQRVDASWAQVRLQAFYEALPGRRWFLLAYAGGALGLAAVVRGAWRMKLGEGTTSLPPASRWMLLVSANLVAALLAVQTGGRFFAHYYLYLLPPVCLLAGTWLASIRREGARLHPWLVLAALLIVVDLCLVPGSAEEAAPWRWPASALAWFAVGAMVGAGVIIGRANSLVSRPTSSVPLVLTGLVLAVLLGDLVRLSAPLFDTARTPQAQASLIRLPDLTTYLQQQAQPGDRLFVWGWRPEIYGYSRLEAATRFGTASYVMLDASRETPEGPVYLEMMSDLLMSDLHEREPRFIVDAARCSQTMGRPDVYRLDRYPPLAELLLHHYDLVKTADNCDIYVRRETSASP
jgi:hypothetical protein